MGEVFSDIFVIREEMIRVIEFIEKRDNERINANIGMWFFSSNLKYSGTMTNCSEKGMYIKTIIPFPFNSIFEILIPFKEEVLKIPVKIKRLVKAGDICEGMGVELMNLPEEYLEFVSKLKFVCQT